MTSLKRAYTPGPPTPARPQEGARGISNRPSSERVKLPRGTCRSKWKGKKCQLCSHHSGAVGWHLPPAPRTPPRRLPRPPLGARAHTHLPPLCPNYFRSRETPDARRAPQRRRRRPRLIHCAKAADATSRLRPVPRPAPGCVRAWRDGGERQFVGAPPSRGGPRSPGAGSPVPSSPGCAN